MAQQIVFQQAARTEAKARVGISGPAGSGKTKTALIAAFALVGPQGKVFVIDTENNSASLYADEFPPFATFNMTPEFGYAPKNYIAAITAAESAGAEAIIVDSASHEWVGEGGALDMVDGIASQSKSKNTYNAWRPVTPEHRAFVEKIVRCKAHILCTFRSKVEYEKNDKGGYDKVGLQAITRDGVDYEFTVWCEMDTSHKLWVTKTRCNAMMDKSAMKPDEKFFGILKEWLTGAKVESRNIVFQEPMKPAAKPAKDGPVKNFDTFITEAEQYGLKGKEEVISFLTKSGFNKYEPAQYATYMTAIRNANPAPVS